MSQTSFSRRSVLQLGGTSALLAFLAACGGKEPTSASGSTSTTAPTDTGSANTTLRWLNDQAGDPKVKPAFDEMVKQYKDASGVSVTVEAMPPSTDTNTHVLSRIAAGQSYDLVTMSSYLWFPGWTEAGYTRPMDDIITKLGGLDAFLPDSLFKVEGAYNMVPFRCPPYFMNYRRDWLEDVGEDVPRNWDDLIRASSKLASKHDAGLTFPISVGQGPTVAIAGTSILWSNGVKFFDDEGNVIFDDPDMAERVVACLELLKALQPYFAPGMENVNPGGVIEPFINEQVGITPYAGRLLNYVYDKSPEIAQNVAIEGFPPPETGGKPAVTVIIDGFCVLTPGGHPEETASFVEWISSGHTLDWRKAVPLQEVPALRDMWSDDEWRNLPAVRDNSSAVDKMYEMLTSDDYIRDDIGSGTPGPNGKKPKIVSTDILGKMYQQVLLGGDDPKKAVGVAADALRAL